MPGIDDILTRYEEPSAGPASASSIDDVLGKYEPKAAAPPPNVSLGQSVGRGALAGASMNFGDEVAAVIDTATSKIPGVRTVAQKLHSDDLPSLENPDVSYSERRNAYRQKNSQAQAANPRAYLAGELAGGIATAVAVPGGGAGAAKTIGQIAKAGAK